MYYYLGISGEKVFGLYRIVALVSHLIPLINNTHRSSIMLKLLFSKTLAAVLILFVACFLATPAHTQTCPPITNFEAILYNPEFVRYQWDNATGTNSYILEVSINGQPYFITDLSNNANEYQLEFNPVLAHNDQVTAKLTRNCANGAKTQNTFDFIIIIDAIVYLIGDPIDGGTIKVEPVFTTNDNLIPADKTCGLCSPSFFRLTSGFYGPFGVAVPSSLVSPIEQFRFDKDELCNCLTDAINAGILDVNGGPGPNFGGDAFECQITPYFFQKVDCERKPGERGTATTETMLSNVQLMPNPVTDKAQIRLDLEGEANVTITLFDILGSPVATILNDTLLQTGANTVEVRTETLPTGMYFCAVSLNGRIAQTIKFSVLSR